MVNLSTHLLFQSIPVKLRWIITLSLCIYLLDIFALGFLLHNTPLMDFQSYFYAATAYTQQANIYDAGHLLELSQAQGIQQHSYPYLYPPTLAFYLQSLSHFSAIQASAIFLIFSHLISLLTIAVSLRLSLSHVQKTAPYKSIQLDKTTYLLLAITCITVPFHNNLQIGQINLLVLLNIALCFYASEVQKKPLLAGFFLAIATVIKITPIGLLVYFLFKKHFKVMLSFIIAIILINIPLFISDFGRQMWGAFFQQLYATLSGSIPGLSNVIDFQNFALFEVCNRILGKGHNSTLLSLSILLSLGLYLAQQSFKLRNSPQMILLLLPYLLVMIIISPVTYTHHLIYIFPGVLLLCLSYHFSENSDKKHLWGFMLLAFISCLDFPFYFKGLSMHNSLILSLNIYLLIGLFFYSLFLIQRICSTHIKG